MKYLCACVLLHVSLFAGNEKPGPKQFENKEATPTAVVTRSDGDLDPEFEDFLRILEELMVLQACSNELQNAGFTGQ